MTFLCVNLAFGTLAYIGPGGGIALLGPLFGVIMAVVGALAMVALWPLRYLIKKLRSSDNNSTATGEQAPS